MALEYINMNLNECIGDVSICKVPARPYIALKARNGLYRVRIMRYDGPLKMHSCAPIILYYRAQELFHGVIKQSDNCQAFEYGDSESDGLN